MSSINEDYYFLFLKTGFIISILKWKILNQSNDFL